MSDGTKSTERTFELPMMPVYGIDISRELGSIDSRLTRVENDVQKLDTKVDVVEARLNVKIDGVEAKLTAKIEAVDSKVDSCLVAINRMDERMTAMNARMDERFTAVNEQISAMRETHKSDFQHLSDTIKSTRNLMMGLFGTVIVTVLAGIILQYFNFK